MSDPASSQTWIWSLLSGLFGVIVGSAISAIASFLIYKRQMRTETNRHFVYRLMEELQKIYLAVVLRRGIDESSLDLLEAMNAISFREFRQLDGDLTDLKQKMSAYISDKASLLQSTVTMAENQRKDDVIVAIKSIMRKVERLT